MVSREDAYFFNTDRQLCVDATLMKPRRAVRMKVLCAMHFLLM